jgi:hypothetical protein
MATSDDVREIALSLPRVYEALVGDRVKFRVGRTVVLSLSPDETVLGFGYSREEREALIAGDPEKFFLPLPSDMRYNWMRMRLPLVERDELWELIVNAWWGTVPKHVREDFLASAAGRARGRSGPELAADGVDCSAG